MVCKEDVLLWFKNLDSYDRIDLLYELLNMCLPFELRFLGTCVEEIGKHTYQELRGPAFTANEIDKLSKETAQGLLDETVRHRMLLSLSLLTSRNYSVANWMYKNVLRTDWLEDYIVKGNIKGDEVQSEFLLLFLMAMYHPAFTFEQKFYFGKIFNQLMIVREHKNRVSPKPSGCGFPPGFEYAHHKPMNSVEEPIVPVKTTVTMPCGEETLHQHPPGLPLIPQLHPPQEIIAWSRPGFPCGAPEVPPPFPLSTVSSLVTEVTSPIHSRSNSPHRPPVHRSTAMPPPPQPPPPIEAIPAPLSLDPLSLNSFTMQFPPEVKLPPEAELNNQILTEADWIRMQEKSLKQPNGLRFGPGPVKSPRPPLFVDQFQSMTIDGENSLRRSNSSSSSSLNQTPPDTPTATSMTGAVRPEKSRVNGMPSFMATGPSPGLPICDTASTPPPPYSNCTVPYTTYPPIPAMPNRNMFAYTQSYRHPFTPFPSYQQTNESPYAPCNFPPYLSYIVSSPQFPPRNHNCYNCGASGHTGQDCTGQNIEDITQKKTYTIDFQTQPLPDADK